MKKYLIGGAVVLVVATVIAFSPSKKATVSVGNNRPTYVALGDSVAAGVGLKNDSDSSACNRTNQAYPDQAAGTLNYKLVNLACSGATLPGGILGRQDVNQLLVAPQIEQLFAQPKPSLISITIGANDAQWTSVLAKCYTSECGTAQDTDMVNKNLNVVSTNLRTTLQQIQDHYGTAIPRVIVTGYHQVFPLTPSANCSDLIGIDVSELSWGRTLQTMISSTIQSATAGYSFATFVPINFSGHELCTSDPWVQGLGDKQPYHPTKAGQAAFSKAIISAIKAHS